MRWPAVAINLIRSRKPPRKPPPCPKAPKSFMLTVKR